VKNFSDYYMEENADLLRRQADLTRMKYLQVVIGKTQTIKNKYQSIEEQKLVNREQYAKKIVLSELRHKDAENRIVEYEALERQLVEKLKETSSLHRTALNNLEKVVQDGNRYYQ
jgi:hypothetical protein